MGATENAGHLSLVASPAAPLLQFQANVTSQCGEDGVIAHTLGRIGATNRWCVEVGAYDGRQASNTYALITRHGYSGVLIESDPERFELLQQTYADRPDVIALRRRIGFSGADRLDQVLAGTPVPSDLDLLSIDIDGNDYHVWDGLERYRPRIVVIEFNPTIPNEVDFVQPRDMSVKQGSSLTALARLARSKGYRLIHATVVNGIFVDEPYFPAFGISDDSPTMLRSDLSQVSWLFQTHDGLLHIAGNARVRWHDAPLSPARFQVVPKPLRGFPSDFGPIRMVMWKLWRRWRGLRYDA